MPMGTPHKRLRCSACGSRETSSRIAYTGAGGFHYGEPPLLRVTAAFSTD